MNDDASGQRDAGSSAEGEFANGVKHFIEAREQSERQPHFSSPRCGVRYKNVIN